MLQPEELAPSEQTILSGVSLLANGSSVLSKDLLRFHITADSSKTHAEKHKTTLTIPLIQSVLHHKRPQQGIWGCGNTNAQITTQTQNTTVPAGRVFSLNTPDLVDKPQQPQAAHQPPRAALSLLLCELLPLQHQL